MKNLSAFLTRFKFQINTLGILFIFLTFVDNHDIPTLLKMYQEQGMLEQQFEDYQVKVAQVEKQRKAILGTDQNLEKFARERYFMKKTNEEVFVLVDEFGKIIEE
jgi:cell division protein DivIC